MATSGYERVKRWRMKHATYSADFMRERRHYFRKLYRSGKLKAKEIPKAYRVFALRRAR